MPKSTRRNDLSALVEKYQGLSVVSEIERNLLSADRSKKDVTDLVLCDLFDEKNYHLEKYNSLKDSLKQDGFLVPLIVNETKDGKPEIINGVKRFLLAKSLGYREVPVVKAELTQERKHAYILENIINEGDNALIKTFAFLTLEKKYGYTDQEIASITSLSVNQIRNLKRLDQLPTFVKEGIRDFTISYSEARSLLNLPKERQKELYLLIRKGELSVRDLEKIKRMYTGKTRKRKVTLKNRKIIITFTDEEEAKKFYPQIIKAFSD